MMSLRQWFRPPRHLLALFLAVTIIPATALAWLSWRLLEQDRALASQRVQEQLEHAADLVAADFERRLADLQERLPALAVSPPADLANDGLIVEIGADQIEAHPADRLLYRPFVSRTEDALGSVFDAGEALEFRQQDFPKATAAFRTLADADDPLIQAGALVRLARTLRKNNQHEDALAAYEALERLGPTPVGGVPAELLARQMRCTVLDELNQVSQLRRAAVALYADLQNGRWPLDRTSYEFHSAETRRWLRDESDAHEPQPGALALAAAVESLWEQWQGRRNDDGESHGSRSVRVHDRSMLVVWRSSPEGVVGLVAGAGYLESQWRTAWEDLGVVVALTDRDGHPVLGSSSSAATQQAVRPAADTRLPWTVRVASADPDADLAELAAGRPLLLASVAMMALLVLGGGYFVTRAVTRELAVARLQTDFVSAVSHEFRSPLTAMRHLTELLAGGIVTSEERRRQYYAVLARETKRLHRLVENLLNFRRMEAGAIEYHFEPLDPADLVKQVVAEFQQEITAHDHRIELTANGAMPAIRADREALGRALWNLLDNAAKYSPESPLIWVDLGCEDQRVAIQVRDRGRGIPAAERTTIFDKFVRGATAKASAVEGAGIGLSMVHHIVRAHGGDVRLDSEPGRGSTFTILLPAGARRA